MKHIARFTVIAVTLALAVSPMSPAAATGATGSTFSGGGALSPGWSATPTFQSYSMTLHETGAVATGAAATVTTQVACSLSLNSLVAETAATGAGVGRKSCSGSGDQVLVRSVGKDCGVTYTRVGLEVWAAGTCSITVTTSAGVTSRTTAYESTQLTMVPVTANPFTAYVVYGTAAGA